MTTNTAANRTIDTSFETRVLKEGYGPGAWHGADLKAALADVGPARAYWRPAPGRHNIAEIALHHAYCARAVRAQISGREAEPFVLDGADWFDAADETTIPWKTIQRTVESEQERLAALVAAIETGAAGSPLDAAERFDLVLGITCHAIYHAGQVQLIKRLHDK
jgi:hypothetical protein